MSQAEKLPKSHSAQLHLDGAAYYAGDIDATVGDSLRLSNARQLQGEQSGENISVHPGARAELVFLELFDDEGDAVSIPVTIVGGGADSIKLDFRDQAAEDSDKFMALLREGEGGGQRKEGDEKLLAEFRKRANRQMEKNISAFLDAASEHLFDMSGRPQQMRDMQDALYEAMGILKRGRDEILKAYVDQLEAYFDEPLKPESQETPEEELEFGDLELVDTQEFEDSLTIDRLVKEAQSKFGLSMEALTIRFAELAGTEAIETRLPVHVSQICSAFRESVHGRGLDSRVAPELYQFFGAQVVRRLEPFYTSLNVYLKDQGVRPELDSELESNGSLFDRMRKDKARAAAKSTAAGQQDETPEPPADLPSEEEATDLLEEARQAGLEGAAPQGAAAPAGAAPGVAAPGGDPAGAAAPAAGAPATPATGAPAQAAGDPAQVAASVGRFDAPTLYRSVIDALNFRRSHPVAGAPSGAQVGETGGVVPATGGTPGGVPANSDALASALSAMQDDDQVRTALREQRSVRQYLSQHQADIAGLEGTDGFEAASMNQLDLVDNLFTDISTDIDVTPDLRPIVGDLQIPLAKLALLEPQFFADKNHPARGVIDKVTALASSSNYPNKALEVKVTKIIDNIVKNYKTDSDVFNSALSELDGLTQQQQKALERNVERVVKTQDGQEKLRKAEKAVEKVLSTRVRAPKAPKPIVELVDKGWRDLLKLTFVKQGPNSRAWKDYVKTLDLLSLWLMQQQTGKGKGKGADDEEVKVERALEAEPLLDMVRQQISEALPTHVEHESVLDNLRDVLAGKAKLEYVDVEPPAEDTERKPEEIRKKVEQLPRLRRWVRRVEDLERGTWLTYRDAEGARRRMQLAWVSEDQDRFIFVNERGQKVADLTGVELARKLSQGVKPPTPSEELPLVDQSMYKTLEHVQKSLSFDMNHDALTKLINRDKFIEEVQQALEHAKTKHSNHALLYIDIDKFGIVNDVYDETVGDQILIDFGQMLAQRHDKKMLSARLEGDRFAALLLDRSLEQAIAQAEELRADIEKTPVVVEGEKIAFTASIGVAAILDHTESVDVVLEHGTTAAREAKERGANQVSHFNEDKARVDAYQAEEEAAIKQIEQTLDTKNFVLQAQPIARTEKVDDEYEVEHYEILLAIADESGRLQSPVEFIASAERFGFMTQVDQWVVKQVFAWISQMMDEQKEVPNLAINLSGNSVTDDAFMEFLFEAISEYGVGTTKICFEITETGTINNMVKATDFVNEFKNIGVKFSIDDFGTGLASHSYLRDLPVDYVKIDGTFIQNIHTNAKDFAMAKSINDLAHFLGQETIAEFAESEEVIARIADIGVDYIQGWGVGRPEPLAELADKLEMMEK